LAVRTLGPDVSSLFRRSVPSAPPSIRIANLQKLNQIDCTFLAGLAKLRLSQIDEAEVALKGVLSLDVNLAGHEELRILGARASCLLQGRSPRCKNVKLENGTTDVATDCWLAPCIIPRFHSSKHGNAAKTVSRNKQKRKQNQGPTEDLWDREVR